MFNILRLFYTESYRGRSLPAWQSVFKGWIKLNPFAIRGQEFRFLTVGGNTAPEGLKYSQGTPELNERKFKKLNFRLQKILLFLFSNKKLRSILSSRRLDPDSYYAVLHDLDPSCHSDWNVVLWIRTGFKMRIRILLLSQCGSGYGSRKPNQRIRIRILIRLLSHKRWIST